MLKKMPKKIKRVVGMTTTTKTTKTAKKRRSLVVATRKLNLDREKRVLGLEKKRELGLERRKDLERRAQGLIKPF